jgi:hypothetical protein
MCKLESKMHDGRSRECLRIFDPEVTETSHHTILPGVATFRTPGQCVVQYEKV